MLHRFSSFPGYFPKASKLGYLTSPMWRTRVGNDIRDLARNPARKRGGLEVLVHAGWICQMGRQTGRAGRSGHESVGPPSHEVPSSLSAAPGGPDGSGLQGPKPKTDDNARVVPLPSHGPKSQCQRGFMMLPNASGTLIV